MRWYKFIASTHNLDWKTVKAVFKTAAWMSEVELAFLGRSHVPHLVRFKTQCKKAQPAKTIGRNKVGPKPAYTKIFAKAWKTRARGAMQT